MYSCSTSTRTSHASAGDRRVTFSAPDERFDGCEVMQARMEKNRLHGRGIAFDALKTAMLKTQTGALAA